MPCSSCTFHAMHMHIHILHLAASASAASRGGGGGGSGGGGRGWAVPSAAAASAATAAVAALAAAAAAAAAVAFQHCHAAILANQCRVCVASEIISESMVVALAWAAAAAAGVAWRRRHRRRDRSVLCSTIMRCVCLTHVQLSSFASINHSSASSIRGTLLPQTSRAMLSGVGGSGALTILGKSGNHFLFERDRLACSCQSRDVREIIRALRRSHGSVQLPRPRADGARSRCFWAQLRAWQRERVRPRPT